MVKPIHISRSLAESDNGKESTLTGRSSDIFQDLVRKQRKRPARMSKIYPFL
jgi:hypothetical protein